LAAAGLALTGCGQASPGARALSSAQDKLGAVRSGSISLLLLASPADAAEGRGAGFQVEGPFAVGVRKGSLPVADLRYTRITGSQRKTTRFLSTGSRAFVEVDGKLTELKDAQLADLRVRDEGSAGGLEGLTLKSWLKDPRVGAGPALDGIATEEVTGTADAVAILNDLIGLSAQFGVASEGVKPLQGDAADRVRRAVAGSKAEVVAGKDDHLLRRARATVDLAVTDPKVRQALGDLAGARLALNLEVTNLNQPVQVTEPPSRR